MRTYWYKGEPVKLWEVDGIAAMAVDPDWSDIPPATRPAAVVADQQPAAVVAPGIATGAAAAEPTDEVKQ